MPILSVVIAAYNAAGTIGDTLSSLRKSIAAAGADGDVEVIVVDDGSTDSTAAIAAGDGADVISRANGGVAAARNSGVERARGEYILFVDADDTVGTPFIGAYLSAAVSGDPLIAGGHTEISLDGTRHLHKPVTPGKYRLDALAPHLDTYICSKAFRRDILVTVPFDERLATGEDAVLLIHFLSAAIEASRTACATVTGDTSYTYIRRADSLTHRPNHSPEQLAAELAILGNAIGRYPAAVPERWHRMLASDLHDLLRATIAAAPSHTAARRALRPLLTRSNISLLALHSPLRPQLGLLCRLIGILF